MHAFNTLVLETLNQKYPNREDEKGRTIYISYGTVPATVRKMTPAEKEMLFNNGVAAVSDFLQLHY